MAWLEESGALAEGSFIFHSMIKENAYDFLPIVREKFPERDLIMVPVSMKEYAYAIQDRETHENVADVLYEYCNCQTLFGYKYKLKYLK